MISFINKICLASDDRGGIRWKSKRGIEVKEIEESDELEEAGIFGASDLKPKVKEEDEEEDVDFESKGIFFPNMSDEEPPTPEPETAKEPEESTFNPPEQPPEEPVLVESSQPKPIDPTNGRSQVLAQQVSHTPNLAYNHNMPPLHANIKLPIEISGFELGMIDIVGRYLFMEGHINSMEPEGIIRYCFHYVYNYIKGLLAGGQQPAQ